MLKPKASTSNTNKDNPLPMDNAVLSTSPSEESHAPSVSPYRRAMRVVDQPATTTSVEDDSHKSARVAAVIDESHLSNGGTSTNFLTAAQGADVIAHALADATPLIRPSQQSDTKPIKTIVNEDNPTPLPGAMTLGMDEHAHEDSEVHEETCMIHSARVKDTPLTIPLLKDPCASPPPPALEDPLDPLPFFGIP